MTENPNSGDVEIELDGRSFTMRPSFRALMEIEAATGTNIMTLVRRFAAKSFGIGDVAAIVTAGLKAAGEPASKDKVGELVFKTGLLKVATPAGEFLWNALGTGRDVAEPETPGPETPGDEEQEDDGASQD